ncbi:hypothetical protein LPU83_pLPU83b_0060 (plasmid) [Rhizobium favelukesii]|uniref:Uncharacterized protein n=1 Tax=Rhizobium favelukesii TaxID=348824 RepID=W6RI62_9HYPH|nr:hypothetical protein LPU83_pLPU83b_0060 [Rhizobium favelukesii]
MSIHVSAGADKVGVSRRINPFPISSSISTMLSVSNMPLPLAARTITPISDVRSLTVANGSETFETIMNGEAMIEKPDPRESGEKGRRWNRRQVTP